MQTEKRMILPIKDKEKCLRHKTAIRNENLKHSRVRIHVIKVLRSRRYRKIFFEEEKNKNN